jgi:isopentenyl phosphate kinase
MKDSFYESDFKPEFKILKIGGSVLTEKKSMRKRIRRKVLKMIATEISQSPENLILIHGAGSFGHYEASLYRNGFNAEGLSLTHHTVSLLNREVVSALRNEGVSAVGIPPLSCCIATSERISRLDMNIIMGLTEMGVIPVLHGDVVLDVEKGVSVISGDQIATYLAREVGNVLLGFATLSHGVLDRDKNTIPLITPENFDENMFHEIEDMTGGMKGKVIELLSLASEGINSWIFSGLERNNIRAFLNGEPQGTCITGGIRHKYIKTED